MIKKQFLFPVILLIVSIVSGNNLQAQSLKLNPKTFIMTIAGTTNVHNFESKVTQANGEIVVNAEKKIQSFGVEIPVKGIKSNEKLMDTKTYEAFNADKNPMITFKSTDVSSLKMDGSDISVSVNGNMTIAGVTRKITLTATGKMVKPGIYLFSGSIPVKMTDYKMKPPTAMMGVMRVGDDIKLKYSVTFEGPAINS
jgi:polyisoprenoid-binding protein YceI